MFKKDIKKNFLMGFILIIVGIISFVYWRGQKEVWFCDEIYSYESANGFEQSWPATYVDQWMAGADVEAFFAADSEEFSLQSISNVLYNDHVPLYFWLFRVVSVLGFMGSGSIWIGLSINLFFYILFLGIGYYWFLRITDNPFMAGASMLILGVVNKVMLAQITMLRMYMMLLWAELMLLLIGLKLLQQVKCEKMKGGVFICLFIFSVIGFLTHYDYWIFYAITAAMFCLWLLFLAFKKQRAHFWKTKEFKYVLAWVGNFVASIVTTIILFPYCRWNLNRGKGQIALQSIFVFSKEKLEHIAWGFERLGASFFGEKIPVFIGLALMFGCIIGGAVILYQRKEVEKLVGMVLMVLVSMGYQLIVCFTMPSATEERYLWGTFTLMHMCMIWGGFLLLEAFLAKKKTIKVAVYTCLVSILVIGQLLIVDGGNGVAYLFHPDKDVEALERHSNIPWIVYGAEADVYSYYDWMIPENICFLTKDNTEEDAKAVLELKNEGGFVLYTYQDNLANAIVFFEQELDKALSSQLLTKSTNLNVYVISEVK